MRQRRATHHVPILQKFYNGPAVIITNDGTRFRVPGVETPTLADIAVDDMILAGGVTEEDGLHAVVVGVVPERPAA